jgi:small subunit ribosomal protein S20
VANIKSQIKRNRTNLLARQRNKAVRSELKTHLRTFRAAADAGDRTAADAAFATAARKLDKAVSKGVVHANFAANKKQRMAHRLTSI